MTRPYSFGFGGIIFQVNLNIELNSFNFIISVEDPNKPHAEDNAEKVAESEHKGNVYTDKALEETIDYVLKSMDLNNDGFVDYAEYRKTEANIGKD